MPKRGANLGVTRAKPFFSRNINVEKADAKALFGLEPMAFSDCRPPWQPDISIFWDLSF